MAKSTNPTVIPADVDYRDAVLEFGDFDVHVTDLPNTAIAYLLQYGFAKSLQDSVAGLAKKTREELAKSDPDADEEEIDLQVEETVGDAQRKRFDAILSGTVGRTSTGPRAQGIDRVMRDVAKEWIAAGCATHKKTMPTKAAELNPMIDGVLAKHGDAIRDEASRRIEAKPTIELDIFA